MSVSREDIRNLQSLGTTAQGDWLRTFLAARIEERCDINNLQTEADLAGAKVVRDILREDILRHLSTPQKEEEEGEDALVNEYD